MFNPTPKYLWKTALAAFVFCGSASTSAQNLWPEGARAGAWAVLMPQSRMTATAFLQSRGIGLFAAAPALYLRRAKFFSSGFPLQNSLGNENAILASHVGVVYNRLARPNQTLPVLVLASTAAVENQPASKELAPTPIFFRRYDRRLSAHRPARSIPVGGLFQQRIL
jgi:hypothetical protein